MEARSNLDCQYLDMLRNVTFQPAFLIGDSRTGTTILYKMLGATECINIVTAYHIINYTEILFNYANCTVADRKKQLATYFNQKGLRNRGYDHVEVGPDTPEEYGHILGNAGYRSQLTPDNLERFVTFCRKVQFTSDSTKPLLLKNPWDCLNFVYIKEAFPDSKLIFIHRNPIHTINSQLVCIRYLLSSRNEYTAIIEKWYRDLHLHPLRLQVARFLFSPNFTLGLRVVTRHVGLATNYFLEHISSLPESDYVSVKYEDLCKKPELTIRRILDKLEIDDPVFVDYESFIDVRTRPLLSEVKRHSAAIIRKMQPYFEHFGYGLADDGERV